MGPGRLVFKGEEKAKKKKRKSKHHSKEEEGNDHAARTEQSITTSEQHASSKSVNSGRLSESKPEASSATGTTFVTPQIRPGTGKITTSQTVVTGYDTKFTKQLHVGDAIVLKINGLDEMRVITMCLSDTSINLSSSFSQNVSQPTSFFYINKPQTQREAQAKQAKEASLKEMKEQEERSAGTFGSTKELVYRERTEHGSYRIKKQKVNGEVSRADLLDLRAKKTSDKYC